MRTIVLQMLAAVVLAGTALADGTDPMQPVYGNTVVFVGSDGVELHTNYNSDNSFMGRIPAQNYNYQGSWQIDGNGNLCRTFSPPLPGHTNPDCYPLTAHAVGDTWTTPNGATVSIIAGIQ